MRGYDMHYRLRQFNFNEEMESDMERIRNHFNDSFGVKPSNTRIMNLLLQIYKESKLQIKRKPKSKRRFLIDL